MKQWFALLVKPHKEKVVENNLTKCGFDNYLPLKQEWHKWSDRRKLVSIPLIPSYIFVNIENQQVYDVLSIPNTLRFIYFNKQIATIPDEQIESLKILIENEKELFIQERSFSKGDKVLFVSGKFKGMQGIILEDKENRFFIVRLDSIALDIMIKLNTNELTNIEKIK